MKAIIVRILFICTICLTSLGWFWQKKVPVGDTEVTYKELCSIERPKCVPDGEFYKIMDLPRPAITRKVSGNDYTEEWTAFLGRAVRDGNETATEPCIKLSDSDYSEDFVRHVDVDLVSDTDITANIGLEVEAALSGLEVDNKPALVSKIERNIVKKLRENAYTKYHYKVINMNYTVLDEILVADVQGSEELECKTKIKDGDAYLIRSLAAIGSEGKLRTNHFSEIKSIIAADLSGIETTSGSPVDAALTASLSLEITKRTEKTLSAITDGHTTLYAMGFWGPEFAEIDVENEKFIKEFIISPAVEARFDLGQQAR